MKTAKDFRAIARENLHGNWTNAILTVLVFEAIMSICSSVPFATIILTGVMQVGLALFFLKFHRKQNADIKDLFLGFNDFAKNFMLGLLHTIYIVLWTLLLIIPGIIKAYSYSMSMYIRNDQPSLEAGECITKSREMMDGHKWRLFCLDMSFIGWILLCILSFGIGFIWLTPYMQTARTAFYEDLKAEKYGSNASGVENENAITIETWQPEDITKDFQ